MFYLPVLRVTFEKTHPDAIIPTYATPGDSGMDVYTLEDTIILPGKTVLIKTGLKLDIPMHPHHAQGYRWEVQVRPRSGTSFKTGLRIANSPGTVDNFYRDELKIVLYNDFYPSLWHEANGYGGLEIEPKKVQYVYLADGTILHSKEAEPFPHGTYFIAKHDRIAQLVFNEIIRPVQIEEGKVGDKLSRGSSFGGTGINK